MRAYLKIVSRSKQGCQSFLFCALKNHFYAEAIIGTGAIYAATNKKELENQNGEAAELAARVTPSFRLMT
jgi:hypothetical protein